MSDTRTLFARTAGILAAFAFMVGCALVGFDALLRASGWPGLFPWSAI